MSDPDDDLFAEVLLDALNEAYGDADDKELDEAVTEMLESVSPAEAYGLAKAITQIGRGAGTITSDPTFGRIAATVLPAAFGTVGASVGGPVGAAAAGRLGAVAARSLPRRRRPGSSGSPVPRAAGGSQAAARALVLSQHPDALRGLLALALGAHGRRTVSGVPVAALMSMLSTVFGRAAADADELNYLAPDEAEESSDISWIGDDDDLYAALLDADNAEVDEAVGWR